MLGNTLVLAWQSFEKNKEISYEFNDSLEFYETILY